MLGALDRNSPFVRPNLSLPSVVGGLIDPLVIVAMLAASAAIHGIAMSPAIAVLAVLAFALSFPGNVRVYEPLRRVVRKVIVDWLLIVGLLGLFGYVSGYLFMFPPAAILTWLAATPVVLIATHIGVRSLLPRWIAANLQPRTAVIAGVNETSTRLIERLRGNALLNTRVVACFDDRSGDRLSPPPEAPVLGRLTDIAAFVKDNRIDLLYLALPMAAQPRVLALLDELKDTTASIYFVPDIFVTDLIQGRMEDIDGIPVVAVCETPFTGLAGVAKRIMDIVLGSLILVLLTPVLLAVAIGVKRSSPGPIIFKQRRYGLDGAEILVYKFRSMTATDNGDVVKQATRNDQRITPFGAFIRRTSLDELPQFINVLQGRMSIVGPRPHAVSHNEMYRKLIRGYMIRHKVKPGITGWAQVNGYRGETETIDKMEKRIEFDLEYLRRWSLGLDLWIIIKTVLLVVKDRNAY